MKQAFQEVIRQATNAEKIFHIEDIQSLWSGYGKIMRYGLQNGMCESVIVKHVKLPDRSNHPRGWNTDISHQRKVKSYQVESTWYRDYANACDERCRVPSCFALESSDNEFLMVLEDLDASGFPIRKNSATINDMQNCLSWLANFHAIFMNRSPTELWQVGTYWHLDTRPDELEALADTELKNAAKLIDKKLQSTRYQTLVHGDAKLANFCFSDITSKVAAVDFQYVGGGCGMKDVAYFIGSCLHDADCEQYESPLLDYYFTQLRSALITHNSEINIDEIEQQWRGLYPFAWTDFHRFVKGWSPGHWKIHSYSERLAHEVVTQLNQSVGLQ